MANTLFQFVALRGTSRPSLTTQDLSSDTSSTITGKNNYKPISEYSEEEKKTIKKMPYQWTDKQGTFPMPVATGKFKDVKFDEIRQKLNEFLINKDDYNKIVQDLELVLYKKSLNVFQDKEAELVYPLQLMALLNGYIHKKEIGLRLPGTTLITDVRVSLPTNVLIGRKHEKHDKSQIPAKDIKSSELYDSNNKLLKEIATGNRPEYSPRAVLERVRDDSQMLSSVSNKIGLALDDARQKNIDEYQKEFVKLNPPASNGKKGVFSKAASFLFGEPAKKIKEPAAVAPAAINAHALALNAGEKELLEAVGLKKEMLKEDDLLVLNNHSSQLEMLTRKMGNTVDFRMNLPGRFADLSPVIPLPALPLPLPLPPPPTPFLRPEIRNVGVGDLYRVEEKTIGYRPTEISYIENVMTGETRKRLHSKIKEIETIRETETEEETETEKDLTTTNRFNLKSETDKTLKEDFNFQGGVNTSGQYGPVKVDTTTQVSFQRSSEQATKEAIETANEVVSKAVERTKTSARELIRVTERLKLSEKNEHDFENKSPNPHINGIFQFVDKVKEVSLLHYGRRLMLEFYVPEPAMTLLQKRIAEADPDYPDPGTFTLNADDIQPDTYTSLALRFGTGSLDTPPPLILSTSFSWKSSVDEGAEGDGEETAEGKILVPHGYYSEKLYYSFAALRNDGDSHAPAHISISVGGESIIDTYTKHIASARILPVIQSEEGLAVSVRVRGHFDKTAVVNLRLQCRRTEDLLDSWRLKVFQDCKQRFDELKGIYLRRKEELRFSEEPGTIGRSELENRQTIQKELKKWCIKAIRGVPQDIDDTLIVGGLVESDPFEALQTQPLIWFHENSFEWSNMVYIFYPYFWGSRSQWRDKLVIRENDFLFQEFLQAGYSKVIVPVNPEAEEIVLRYVGDPTVTESVLYEESLAGTSDPFGDLWMELLEDKIAGLARGSGTLSVTNGQTRVTINTDSSWALTLDDLARVLVIEGIEYEIVSINPADDKEFQIDRNYERTTNAGARYFIKGKRIGSPWQVLVPTQLTYLTNKTIDLLP